MSDTNGQDVSQNNQQSPNDQQKVEFVGTIHFHNMPHTSFTLSSNGEIQKNDYDSSTGFTTTSQIK
jgi:hypothetical protein